MFYIYVRGLKNKLRFSHALAVIDTKLFTFAASWVAVHLVRHTCCTKAPPMMRAETMSYELSLTATTYLKKYKLVYKINYL